MVFWKAKNNKVLCRLTEEIKINKLIINNGLPTLNEYIEAERSNKYAAAKMKKQATDTVAWLAKVIPKHDGAIWVNFHWIEPNKRKDKDNVAFAKKFVFDGLVKSGVIRNDGWNDVYGWSDTFEVVKGKRCVEITIMKGYNDDSV